MFKAIIEKISSKLEKKAQKIVDDYNKKLADEQKKSEFVIPEPEVIDGNVPQLRKEHDAFNVIITDNNANDLMYRVKSENSIEVFRMNCTGYNYDTDSVYNLAPEALGYGSEYLTKISKYHFICRVFVTANNRFFYQYIRQDESTAYSVVERHELQVKIQHCESSDSKRFFSRKGRYVWSAKPGTYTNKTYSVQDIGVNGEQCIDSYEVINRELYNKIIEDL